MSLQAALNNQAIESLGVDFIKWIGVQDLHHSNQIRSKAIRFMCNNQMPETCPKNDIYIESLIRSCDSSFRNSEGYFSWSKWWADECNEEWDGDENVGFSYTVVKYDECSYEWGLS